MRPAQLILPTTAALLFLLFLLSGPSPTLGCNKALCASDVSKCLIQVRAHVGCAVHRTSAAKMSSFQLFHVNGPEQNKEGSKSYFIIRHIHMQNIRKSSSYTSGFLRVFLS